MATDIEFRYPPLWFGSKGRFTPVVLEDNLIGAWFFNKKTGETNAQAAQRGSFNKAKGASNNAIDRRWIGGLPTFYTNYCRFTNGTPLVTNIADFGSGGGCFFMVSRSEDDTIGSTSNDRAYCLGTYGGNTNKGWGFEYASDAASTARMIDYPASGGVVTNQIDMGTSVDDLEKWRLYYGETGRVSGSDGLLAAVNLNPGDGTTPDPADTTLTGGRATGTQTLSIGGRISDTSSNYTTTVHKDIAFILLFDALPTTEQRGLIATQCAAVCTAIGITLGS